MHFSLFHFSFSTTAEAEHKYLPTTLASTQMDKHTAANVTLPLGLELAELEELLWFFRREDRKSHWCSWAETQALAVNFPA